MYTRTIQNPRLLLGSGGGGCSDQRLDSGDDDLSLPRLSSSSAGVPRAAGMHKRSEIVAACRGPCISHRSFGGWPRTYDSDIDETAESHNQLEHGQLQGLSIRVIFAWFYETALLLTVAPSPCRCWAWGRRDLAAGQQCPGWLGTCSAAGFGQADNSDLGQVGNGNSRQAGGAHMSGTMLLAEASDVLRAGVRWRWSEQKHEVTTQIACLMTRKRLFH